MLATAGRPAERRPIQLRAIFHRGSRSTALMLKETKIKLWLSEWSL